jgi:hypothetical protein
MKWLIIPCFFALNVLAQDYTLENFENQNYRDFTLEEFKQKLGADAELLSFYKCDGKKEFDLFTPAPRQNPNGDSLKVRLPEDGRVLIYRKGKFTDSEGKVVTKSSDPFFQHTKDALKKIRSFYLGAKLLKALESSYYPLTIEKGLNSFVSQEEDGVAHESINMASLIKNIIQGRAPENLPFKHIGVGGKIRWNPDIGGPLASPVLLIHELFHALDGIRGLLDMRYVVGEKYELTQVSEYRAIFVENYFRQYMGYNLRTHLGNDTTGPGVLDKKGRPINIPSPCIK